MLERIPFQMWTVVGADIIMCHGAFACMTSSYQGAAKMFLHCPLPSSRLQRIRPYGGPDTPQPSLRLRRVVREFLLRRHLQKDTGHLSVLELPDLDTDEASHHFWKRLELT